MGATGADMFVFSHKILSLCMCKVRLYMLICFGPVINRKIRDPMHSKIFSGALAMQEMGKNQK